MSSYTHYHEFQGVAKLFSIIFPMKDLRKWRTFFEGCERVWKFRVYNNFVSFTVMLWNFQLYDVVISFITKLRTIQKLDERVFSHLIIHDVDYFKWRENCCRENWKMFFSGLFSSAFISLVSSHVSWMLLLLLLSNWAQNSPESGSMIPREITRKKFWGLTVHSIGGM